MYWTVSPAAAATCDAALQRRWRVLRARRGHFEGGRWRDEVDRWDGEKHRTMKALAACALAGRADADQLRRSLGPPDETLEPSNASRGPLQPGITWIDPNAPTGGSWWVYRWRGRHDLLLLAFDSGRVANTGWWAAGE